MSHLLDDDDVDDLQGRAHHRELTLSNGTILGIFLGLALLLALFFGFGYNMGNKARQAAIPPAADNTDATAASGTNFNSFKPAAGSPAGQPATTPHPTDSGPADVGSAPVYNVPPGSPAHTNTPADPTATAEKPAPISLHPATAVEPSPNPVTASTGTFVVQVAAVSHQEDATLLVNALHAKGYSVSAHPGADNLIHIQVGPFSTHKEADSMRQQLLSDGYNAIVK